MALSEQQIVDLVNHEFENSIGTPGGDISRERTRAYEYYLRKLYGWEEEGDSKLVTSEVADVVDGILISLMRMFSTADNLAEFQPFNEGDEDKARQESDYVEHVFFQRNPAFEILFFWFFDALVQKVGYVKAHWDKAERITTETYENLSDMEVMELLEDEELEAVEREERPGTFADPQTGMLVEGVVNNVKFQRTTKRGKCSIENVPPEEIRISKGARHLSPGKARMVGQERDDLTRDDLLAMGFDRDKVMALPGVQQSTDSNVKGARRDKSDDQGAGGNKTDPSQELVGPFREAYMKIDVNEDGRSELKQVFIVDGKLLEIDDIDSQPFHALCPHPLPHKHVGEASAEKVMDLQLGSSHLIREIMMNLNHTNNPGHTVWEQAMTENTMSDLLTRKVGRVVRVRRPVGEAMAPETVPFTAAESFPMVEYFDRKKTERTGIGFDSEGLTPDALKNIQISVMAEANDIKRMKVEMIARIFAETGIKSLFLHMHELLQKHQQDEDVVRLRGKWVAVRPSEWRTRYDMTATIGLGIANRDRNLLHLNAIWEKQVQMQEGGGANLIVKPKHFYNTMREIINNANIGKGPETFVMDPGEKMSPPASDEQMQLQKAQLQVQAQAEENRKQKNANDLRKIQLDAQEAQARDRIEVAKVHEQREARLDKLHISNQQLRNELHALGIEMTDKQADRVLKRITAQAQADQARANARQAEALARKADAEAQSLRREPVVDTGEAKRKERESDAKVKETEAKIEQIEAQTEKTRKESKAIDVEIDAAERGIDEVLGDDGGEPEESE